MDEHCDACNGPVAGGVKVNQVRTRIRKGEYEYRTYRVCTDDKACFAAWKRKRGD